MIFCCFSVSKNVLIAPVTGPLLLTCSTSNVCSRPGKTNRDSTWLTGADFLSGAFLMWEIASNLKINWAQTNWIYTTQFKVRFCSWNWRLWWIRFDNSKIVDASQNFYNSQVTKNRKNGQTIVLVLFPFSLTRCVYFT